MVGARFGKIDAPGCQRLRDRLQIAPVGFKRVLVSAVSAGAGGVAGVAGGAMMTGCSFEAGISMVISRVSGFTKVASAYIAP